MGQEKLPKTDTIKVIEDDVEETDIDKIYKAKYRIANKLINKAFASLATGQGDVANMKTYGSFEPLNGSYKFNVAGSIGESKPILFNVSVKGSINSNNIGVLFDQSKFSSGTSISGKIHVPVFNSEIRTDVRDEDIVKKEIANRQRAVDNKMSVLSNRLQEEFISNQVRVEEEKLPKLISDYAVTITQIKILQPSIDAGPVNSVLYADNLQSSIKLSKYLRGLDTLIINSQFKIDSLDFLLLSRHRDDVRDIESDKVKKALDAKSDSLWLTLPIKAYEMNWLSVVGSYGRNKYYTFTEGGFLSQHYKEMKQDIFYVGLEYNRYVHTGTFHEYGSGKHDKAKKPRPRIYNFGAVWMGGTDIDDYSTTELSSSRKFAAGDTTNTLGKKYNVYTDPVNNYKAIKFYGNFYYVFGKSDNFAIHPFAEVELRDSHDNPFGMGLGLVFSLQNKKEKAVFNVELYGKLKDMGRALPQTELVMIRRNEIGLNFAVPLNLPSKK